MEAGWLLSGVHKENHTQRDDPERRRDSELLTAVCEENYAHRGKFCAICAEIGDLLARVLKVLRSHSKDVTEA